MNPTLAMCGLVAIAGVIVGALWIVPQLQVQHLQELRPEQRFDRINEARKTLAQILGGVVLLGGFYFNWRGQNQQAQDDAESQRIARNTQITEAFSKAVEQLGGAKLEVQLGGIFGLERLAKEPAMNHWSVVEVLSAYVRTQAKIIGPVQPLQSRPQVRPVNVQAVLTVLARRDREKDDGWLDLRNTDLAGMDLTRGDRPGANFAYADFANANLQWVDLRGASLRKAYLANAHLEHAELEQACLNEADLSTAFFTIEQIEQAWWNQKTKFPKDKHLDKPFIRKPEYCEE